MPRVIEILEGEHGWTVIGAGRFASSLSSDEALWAVATLLMHEVQPCRYLKTYAEEMAWWDRYHRTNPERAEPMALLEDLRVRTPVLVARRMGRVVRTFDELGQLVNRSIRLKGNS